MYVIPIIQLLFCSSKAQIAPPCCAVHTFRVSIPVWGIEIKTFCSHIWFDLYKNCTLYVLFLSYNPLSVPKITSRAARLFFIPVQIILLANNSILVVFQPGFVWLTATPATYQQTQAAGPRSQVPKIRPKGTHPAININALRCRSPIILSILKSFFIPTSLACLFATLL